MSNRSSLKPTLYVTLGMTFILVALATEEWTVIFPIAGAVAGYRYWQTRTAR